MELLHFLMTPFGWNLAGLVAQWEHVVTDVPRELEIAPQSRKIHEMGEVGTSKSLFQPTRLSVHLSVRPCVRTCVRHKIFFCLNHLGITPWLLESTPGVDPGYPPGHAAPPEELGRARRALSSFFQFWVLDFMIEKCGHMCPVWKKIEFQPNL